MTTAKPKAHPSRPNATWVFGATIFLGAFLLFQIQPLMGKVVLPWFGGGPAVWTTSLMFFQSALFIGYLYTHLTTRLLGTSLQPKLHAIALVFCVASLLGWGMVAGKLPDNAQSQPVVAILSLLGRHIGVPYIMLAATAPLVQFWYSRVSQKGSPYRLYALSNAGSLLALLSYPFVVEPYFKLSNQAAIWIAGFMLFSVLCVICINQLWSTPGGQIQDSKGKHEKSGGKAYFGTNVSYHWSRIPLWLALAACGTMLLLATTTYLSQDVASFPLIWILPLGIYLLSFIISFDNPRWYRRQYFYPLMMLSSLGVYYCWLRGSAFSLNWQLLSHLGMLFFTTMVCHGELSRFRPGYQHLTAYYLCISGGGALGGIFVSVVAPRIFPDYYEMQLAVLICWVLAMVVVYLDPKSSLHLGRKLLVWLGWGILFVVFAILLWDHSANMHKDAIARSRNFYGVLAVLERGIDTPNHRNELRNGRIIHGSQFISEGKRDIPTQYYNRQSGVGLLLRKYRIEHPKRIGVVGLGVGTLAAYGHKGDLFRFYEINPDVIQFSQQYFSFLKDSPATMQFVVGDARISLRSEQSQQFDVLVLDAFSGDSIPVHLLTEEAFAQYLRHMKPTGIIAAHISNLHLDLAPVVRALAERYSLYATAVTNPADREHGVLASSWVLLARDPTFLQSHKLGTPLDQADVSGITPELWTDDYSNLLHVIRGQ